ncbi:hypothetical protein AJ79_09350 [Helicocarpus griseus UAMH5409]|uniref:Major facilitator superfamily (MFS) profile domain-containing protein n=1 Tax=Helicocarpus griseus UAMH5409 TaxID=1447875 RepID=A0A2B7WKF0_9EURO|nr:hypothetical protein AJ79_09350 [Helicocarpus griseus UAMH5409]
MSTPDTKSPATPPITEPVTDPPNPRASNISDTASATHPEKPTSKWISSAEDVAAALADRFFGEEGSSYSKEEERRLRWKLDLRLVPLLWFNATLGYLDKMATATCALYGMKEDTKLVGDQYSWVGGAFYFGYLFWCFPSASLLQKFSIPKTMASAQVVWGFILIGMGFSNNFATLIALRVLLGLLEAPIVPGNILVMSMWYTRPEQSLRYGLTYTGLSSMFTGPIGWAIGFIDNTWYNPWRAFFWILGTITVVWALILGYFLPDNPVKSKFLDEREKAIAIDRVRVNQTGIENKQFKREQFIEALTDVKTWLMVAFNLCISIPNGSLTNFSPLIVNGLGYSAQRSALLMMPTGIIQTVSSYICNGGVFLMAKHYPRHQVRGIFIIFGIVVGMIAVIFLYTLPITDLNSRLAALYMSYFYFGPYVVSLSLVSANFSGHTKKVTVNALIFIAYCISNIIGPQFFKNNQAPLYPLGVGAILGSYVLSLILIVMFMVVCWAENCRRDRRDEAARERVHADTDFRDMTDKQNIHFRYIW